MTETFGAWLSGQMRRKGLSQSELARGAGVNRSAVSRWINELSMPDPKSCALLARFFNEPVEKVYALAGHPLAYEPAPQQLQSLHERTLEFLAELPIRVPVVDQLASAGPGQQVMDYVYIEPSYQTDGRYVAIRVKGRSMEPDYRDGDTIIIDTEDPAEVGDTVVATVGDDVYVKDLVMHRGELMLMGRDGKRVPVDETRIEGRVIQSIRHVGRR